MVYDVAYNILRSDIFCHMYVDKWIIFNELVIYAIKDNILNTRRRVPRQHPSFVQSPSANATNTAHAPP
jgi:hypothetical protein